MSKFRRFAGLIIITEIILVVLCNLIYISHNKSEASRIYRVEAGRIVRLCQDEGLDHEQIEALDLTEYDTILNVSEFDATQACSNDYVVENINGRLYRIEYRVTGGYGALCFINVCLIGMILITVIVLVYVNNKVLKPFHSMSNLSYELAKGNLSMPVKEEKSKLFGKFLWGMDMLREKLEDNKAKELELQRERKTLILSLSHDIKTPLSSIELYAKALSEGLYDSEDKKEEVVRGIGRNAQEIKKYVNEIVTASREDFLNLQVEQGEHYLSEIIEVIKAFYKDKLSVVHTELIVDEFGDCLVVGDKNRLIEVLQNVIENAIKYGDGRIIHISFDEEEDCRLVNISNSGCDLPAEELSNLFDSFYRGSNSKNAKGNGLGLYICKNLMLKMDGDIYAQIKENNFQVTVVIRMA